ncbi:MAG: hypothetical protein HC812_13765 [Leptolyngbya sp. RL_3_1]|nr:hypothetical protein [Leptolyngbya sp. RL_3_1]
MSEQGGKYGNLIKRAKQSPKPDDQIPVQPVEQVTNEPDNQTPIEMANLCVKVPKKWRKHWAIQAKVKDITMTEVMVEALKARFGLPDDQ